MALYLIRIKDSQEHAPLIMFGKSPEDACRLVGLNPADCDIKDITHRGLQPKHINTAPLTADFLRTDTEGKP
jgi:hypothetical protein